MKEYNVPISSVCPTGLTEIYTVEEADKLGIKYIPYMFWRRAEEGERVETVDNHVTIVIKRNDKSEPNYIRTPTGTYAIDRKGTVFDTFEFYERCSFSRKSRWNGSSKKNTPQQDLFFKALTENGFDFNKALKIAYPIQAKTRLRFSSRKKEFINSKKYLDFMKKTFEKIAEDAGINHEYLIKRLKDFLEHGSVGDRATLLKMADTMIGGELFTEQPANRLPSGNRIPLLEDVEEADQVVAEIPERVDS